MKALSNRYFVKIFVYVTLTVAITVIALSFILYFQFEDLVLKKVHSYVYEDLSEIDESVENMQASAKMLSMQIYYDLHVSKLILYQNPSFEDINLALSQLMYYSMIPKFVDSIYVYNTNTGMFYTSPHAASVTVSDRDSFFDEGAVDIIDNLESYESFFPLHRTIDTDNASAIRIPTKEVFTFLYYGLPAGGKATDGVIFINISKEWLLSEISGFDKNIDNELHILHDDGSVILDRGSVLSEDNLMQLDETMASRSGSGYFFQNGSRGDALVTYLCSDSFPWKYVSFTAYDDVVREVKQMQNAMILVGLLIMSVGLVLSIIVSRTIYIPFQDVQGKLLHLQNEKQQHLDRCRQDFLKTQLMEYAADGDSAGDSALWDDFEYFGVRLRRAKPFVLVLAKIDDYQAHFNKLRQEKGDMLKQSAMRLMMKTAGDAYFAEAVDMGKEKIALLIQTTAAAVHADDFYNGLKPCLENIQTAISNDLDFTVSLTVSTLSEVIGDLPLLYNQILEASFQGMFRGNQHVIYAADLENPNQSMFQYPIHKEKQLLSELMQGKTEECKRIYLDIVNDFAGYSRSTVYLAFSYLNFNLNTTINTIIHMNFASNPLSSYLFTISLDEAESIRDVNNRFFRVFDEISERLTEKRCSKNNDLLKKVTEYIENNHSDPNLTVYSISEVFHMSPAHLGKLFKKIASGNIVDFVNNIRVEHAKQMLINTNFTVEQISRQTGFSTIAYFYRVFKKINSLTPNEYRKKMLFIDKPLAGEPENNQPLPQTVLARLF